MPGFIQAHIARGNRNLLLVGGVLVIIGAGLAAFFSHWFPLLLVIPGIIALGAGLRHLINPRGHPIYRALGRLGNLQELIQQVNEDFAGIKPDDQPQLGPHWLAQGNTYGVILVRWQDVAWMHLYVRIRNNARSNYVRVYGRDGTQLTVPAGAQQPQAEQFLQTLHARAPWAEVGYSRELEQQWLKDRASFLQRIDARK